MKNLFRAWGRAWTGGRFAPAPDAGPATAHFRQLSRYSAAFLLAADMALLTMGGALKRREMLSARYGDILSELFLLSAALKRWHDEGRQDADLPLLDYAMQNGLPHHRTALRRDLSQSAGAARRPGCCVSS